MQPTKQKVSVQTATSYVDLGPYIRLLQRRSAWIIAASSIALFFALSLIVDSRRLFWYDEISTLTMVRLPSMAAIWHAMHQPLDGSTPTYFFLEKIFDSGLHHTPLAARLLSSIAVSAGLLVVFSCAARIIGALYALFTVGALMCSFLPYYSYEARSYGLEFLISAVALWVWLHVDRDSWRSPVLFGVCFLLGELGHYYFVFCLIPYCAYEILAWRGEKRRWLALVAAFTGAVLAVVFLLPAVLATREMGRHFWAQVNLSTLNAFTHFFPYAIVPLSLCATWLGITSFRSGSDRSSRVPGMSDAEQLGWLFLLIPIAGIIAGKLVTHAFVERYFITFLPGVGLAIACACSRMLKGTPLATAGVLAIVVGFGLAQQARSAIDPDVVEAGPKNAQQQLTKAAVFMEPKILKDGKQFIVVPDSVLFLEAHFYSRVPDRYPFVPELNYTPAYFTNAITLRNMSSILGFPLWTVPDIEKHAGEVALVDPAEGLLRRLHRDGFQLTVRALDPIPVFYFARN